MAIEDLSATQRLPGDPPLRYVEVWGDTVDPRHLKWAILIGIGVSFSAFLVANAILSHFIHDRAMARAYAMLVGLGGCLAGGAICAKLFEPKRIATALEADEGRRAQRVAQLVADQRARHHRKARTAFRADKATTPSANGGGTQEAAALYAGVASLPPHVIAEMREVGLYELFAEQERLAELGTNRPIDQAASPTDGATNDKAGANTPTPLSESGVIESYARKEAFR